MTYSEKLKDPRWQKKRLQVMEYAGFRCQICGTKDSTLHCHHSYYTKGKQPWQYPDGAIICICERCHEKIHGKKEVPASPIIPDVTLLRPAVSVEMARSRFGALRAAVERMEEKKCTG